MKEYIPIIRIVVIVFETCAAIVAFCYWHKLKDSYWKYFPFYLTWIAAAEWLGLISIKNSWGADFNRVLYNFLVSPSEYLFFLWLIGNFIKNQTKHRHIPLVFSLIYLIVFLLENTIFSTETHSFLSLSSGVATVFLLILQLFYLYNFIFSDEILHYRTSIEFWVIIGITFYYLISFPFYGTWNVLRNKHYSIFVEYFPLVLMLSTLMYACFIVGIIWGKPKPKS